MDIYGSEGEILDEVEQNGLDSILEEPERDSEPREEEMEEEEQSNEDVDSPRASVQPKGKVTKKKRKRSSSEGSSVGGADSEKKVKGPLSNTNKSINVGSEFQAVIEEMLDGSEERDIELKEELNWTTPESIDNEKLAVFVRDTADRYLVSMDKVLFVLMQKGYDFAKTLAEISQKNEIVDEWATNEKFILENAYTHTGKNFHHIQAAVAHRSLRSIIHHYYESKKTIKYRAFAANSKTNYQKPNGLEQIMHPYTEAIMEQMCENCGEKAEDMEMNEQMNRAECRACLIYYSTMGVPRPTGLRLVLSERVRTHVRCPEILREFMKNFNDMLQTSNGEMFKTRLIGELKTSDYIAAGYGELPFVANGLHASSSSSAQDPNPPVKFTISENEPESEQRSEKKSEEPVLNGKEENAFDEEGVNGIMEHSEEANGIVFVLPSPSIPTPPVSNGTSDQASTSNGVILIDDTSDGSTTPEEAAPESSNSEDQEPSTSKPSVYIWNNRRRTVCQEQMQILADDTRRRMFQAYQHTSRVDYKEVAAMKNDMKQLRERMERCNYDIDLNPSFLLSEDRCQQFPATWTEEETQNLVRCFKWYGPQFGQIADVMGTKNVKQVYAYYLENKHLADGIPGFKGFIPTPTFAEIKSPTPQPPALTPPKLLKKERKMGFYRNKLTRFMYS